MNTGNTYYFIDDFNKICKCENGMKSDESIILETYELVDDINRLVEENEQLKNICKNLINEINKRGITVTMSDEYKELLE